MKPLRVVIDINVSVSGLLFGGIPLKVVKAALYKKFLWVISKPLLEEMERVIRSPKFGLTSVECETLLSPILDIVEVVVPQAEINFIKRCPADNRVLECAVEGKAKYIVTGDRRDLLSIGPYKTIKIITARDFFDNCL